MHRDMVRMNGHDPFQLYMQLVRALGEGHAFLLDAAEDAESPDYRMSLVAAVPLLEIQVKDGLVIVFADRAIQTFLESRLTASGFGDAGVCTEVSNSVVAGPPSCWHVRDPLAFLESMRCILQGLPTADSETPFASGLLGYVGYDAVHYLETLPKTTADDRGLPDIRLQWFGVVIRLVDGEIQCFDELLRLTAMARDGDLDMLNTQIETARQIIRGFEEGALHAIPLPAAVTDVPVCDETLQADYERAVERAGEYIRAGDVFQVVLSRRIRVDKRQHPYVAYQYLRALNPSPYMFMAEYPDMRLFGASPEVQFRVVHGLAEMKPIAGTSQGRGRTSAEDLQLIRALESNEKETAEHVMLVDLCRNDLGRICKTGTIRVTELMRVEPYVHLFHLVSKVVGEVRADVSVFHALVSTFPAGTLSGAPKIRAMEIIDQLETVRRGPYGGLIGMIDFQGNANTAIVIRTVVESEAAYYVQAGAGIVADSQPRQEWLECGRKARAVLQVLGVSTDPIGVC